jgi:hypothetical protein
MTVRDPFDVFWDALEAHGCEPKGHRGKAVARCGAADHPDNNPSMGFRENPDGSVDIICRSRGCSVPSIAAGVGVPVRELFPPSRPRKSRERNHVLPRPDRCPDCGLGATRPGVPGVPEGRLYLAPGVGRYLCRSCLPPDVTPHPRYTRTLAVSRSPRYTRTTTTVGEEVNAPSSSTVSACSCIPVEAPSRSACSCIPAGVLETFRAEAYAARRKRNRKADGPDCLTGRDLLRAEQETGLRPVPVRFDAETNSAKTRDVWDFVARLFGLQIAAGESLPLMIGVTLVIENVDVSRRTANLALHELMAAEGVEDRGELPAQGKRPHGTRTFSLGAAARVGALVEQPELLPAAEPAFEADLEVAVLEEPAEVPEHPVMEAAVTARDAVEHEHGLAASAGRARTMPDPDDRTAPGAAGRGLHDADSTPRGDDVLPDQDTPGAPVNGSYDDADPEEGSDSLFTAERLVSGGGHYFDEVWS